MAAGEAPFEFAGQRKHAAAIDVRLDEVRDRLEPGLERLRLAGLHEAEMALGQRDLVVSGQRAENRDPHRLDRVDDEPAMALAADAIDDDAGDAEPRVVRSAALDHRRRRLRLARDVEDEQDRHAERGGDVGRGAAAPALRRNAVEQPHRGFAERELAFGRRLGGKRGEQLGRHGPGIEIDALAPRRRGVEGRIDIIGAGLEADDIDAAALERAQEAERDGRLAAAGARRGDHEGAGHCAPSGPSSGPSGHLLPRGEGIAGGDVAPPLPLGEGWGEGRARQRGGCRKDRNAPYPLIAQALAKGPVTPWARLATASAVMRSASVSGSPTRGSTVPNFCISGRKVL